MLSGDSSPGNIALLGKKKSCALPMPVPTLRSAPGIRWIESRPGWFWLFPRSPSSRLRKGTVFCLKSLQLQGRWPDTDFPWPFSSSPCSALLTPCVCAHPHALGLLTYFTNGSAGVDLSRSVPWSGARLQCVVLPLGVSQLPLASLAISAAPSSLHPRLPLAACVS